MTMILTEDAIYWLEAPFQTTFSKGPALALTVLLRWVLFRMERLLTLQALPLSPVQYPHCLLLFSTHHYSWSLPDITTTVHYPLSTFKIIRYQLPLSTIHYHNLLPPSALSITHYSLSLSLTTPSTILYPNYPHNCTIHYLNHSQSTIHIIHITHIIHYHYDCLHSPLSTLTTDNYPRPGKTKNNQRYLSSQKIWLKLPHATPCKKTKQQDMTMAWDIHLDCVNEVLDHRSSHFSWWRKNHEVQFSNLPCALTPNLGCWELEYWRHQFQKRNKMCSLGTYG